jgi:CelD/BcsL family acetyltransferase involved in cellulose biosynthesis
MTSGVGLAAVTVEPTTDARWRALAATAPQASVFHHPAWLSLLGEQYGYEIVACLVLDQRERVVAGLPVAIVRSRLTGSRLVALPFSDACPPLVATGAAREATGALAGGLDSLRCALGLPLEVREAVELDSARVVPSFHQHVLSLRGDPVRDLARPAVRRAVAKARREGVRIERRIDAAALDDFYRLHLRTRRRQGTPTQPRRFIAAFSSLFQRGLGFVMLARLGTRPVAAAVFLGDGRTLTYKYGASDPAYLDRRPNNLLFAEAIGYGAHEGFERLDFGRTNLDNDGLRAFKLGWGAEEHELCYSYLPRPGEEHDDSGRRLDHAGLAGRALGAVIRRGPVGVGRMAGQVLYRHLG